MGKRCSGGLYIVLVDQLAACSDRQEKTRPIVACAPQATGFAQARAATLCRHCRKKEGPAKMQRARARRERTLRSEAVG